MNPGDFVLTDDQSAYLSPWLNKLRGSIGSCIIMALESERGVVRVGWLNPKERKALRLALERVNQARTKRRERVTTEHPTTSAPKD